VTEAEPEISTARERSRGLVVAVALAVVFGLLSVVMAVLTVGGRDEDKSDREEVFRLSGRFAESLFTFDFADPQRNRDAVLEQVTPSFKDQFEEDAAALFGPAAADLELKVAPKIEDLFVSQIDGGTAGAVVIIDIGTTTKTGVSQLFDDVYLELSLLEIDGEWKVDDLTYTLADDSVLSTGGTGSTTTSVP
jgi:hypothetical protein